MGPDGGAISQTVLTPLHAHNETTASIFVQEWWGGDYNSSVMRGGRGPPKELSDEKGTILKRGTTAEAWWRKVRGTSSEA